MEMRCKSGLATALAGAALLVILLGRTAALAQIMPIENLSYFPRATLTISARGRVDRFRVWIADTRARQAQGLMFVRELPADEGMIFPMRPPEVAQFWMKNTYIPLDMLFVAPDGRIEKIIAHAKPFSLAVLSSGAPVEAVVEIRGGEARKLGITVGARVSWSPIKPK
jgi:uncharacterized membrane protein (UPF0127 family)